MLQLIKVRRARKAAVAAIHPHVERSRARLQGISDAAWRDPYMIGFLAMLITLVAQRREARLGEQALGLVQVDAWEEITGLGSSNIGEEICLLSANGDSAFQTGCDNAQKMFGAIEADGMAGDILRDPDAATGQGTVSASTLWVRYFDDRVGARAAWPTDAL